MLVVAVVVKERVEEEMGVVAMAAEVMEMVEEVMVAVVVTEMGLELGLVQRLK